MRGLVSRGICGFLLLIATVLSGCASNGGEPSVAKPPPAAAEPVGDVVLRERTVPIDLDLAIAVFGDGLTNGEVDDRVFPTIRKAETLLLPVTMASMIERSGSLAIVRVVHGTDVYMPLLLEGEILRADGAVLELQVTLRGADGRLLLSRTYRDEAGASDYPVASGTDPFDDLYRAVSNDVLSALEQLDDRERETLRRVALIRFAADLSPVTFERFLLEDSRGKLSLSSYPADDDPMLARLQRLRRQDELFIDTVDEQYGDLRDQVEESYALWREYAFELQRYGESYRASAADRKSSARRGSYAAMQQVYASYRKVKIQEEDLRGLVKGFGGESLETIMEVDDGVVRLSGSVDQRYAEWRRILGNIYDLETGGLP